MHRTSITFPEKLFRRAKLRAASEGRTLSDVIRSLLERWLEGDVSADRADSEEARKRTALESFGMWRDRSPDAVLEDSRSSLSRRDEELENARLDAR